VCQRAEEKCTREDEGLYDGIDKDIEQLFFTLDPREIEKMFLHYKRDYGREAHEYAVKTFRRWRAGEVRISGQVADRLLAIVPHYISFDQKYRLLENVWKKQGRRRISVAIAPHHDATAAIQQVVKAVDALAGKEFPEHLKHRLTWLTANDTQIAQQLLERLLADERRLVLEALNREIQAVVRLMSAADRSTIRSTHTFSIAGLDICVTVTDRPEPRKPAMVGGSGRWDAWIWAAIIGAGILLFALCNAAERRRTFEYHGPYIPPARHRP
jgi:hypothetical protein